MACAKFSRIYSPRSRGPLCFGVFSQHGRFPTSGKINSGTQRTRGQEQKNQKLEFIGPMFADFARYGPSFEKFKVPITVVLTSRQLNVPFKRNYSSFLSFFEKVAQKSFDLFKELQLHICLLTKYAFFYGRFSIAYSQILADLCLSFNRRTLRGVVARIGRFYFARLI